MSEAPTVSLQPLGFGKGMPSDTSESEHTLPVLRMSSSLICTIRGRGVGIRRTDGTDIPSYPDPKQLTTCSYTSLSSSHVRPKECSNLLIQQTYSTAPSSPLYGATSIQYPSISRHSKSPFANQPFPPRASTWPEAAAVALEGR